MERRVGVRLCVISLICCERDERSQRTFGLTFWRIPVQTILLATVANELHSVLLRAFVRLREISASASASAPQILITANSFLPIRRDRISSFPAARSKNHCSAAFFFSGIGNGKLSAPTIRISDPSGILRQRCITPYAAANASIEALSSWHRPIDNLFRFRTEDCQRRVLVSRLGCFHHRITRVLGGSEEFVEGLLELLQAARGITSAKSRNRSSRNSAY